MSELSYYQGVINRCQKEVDLLTNKLLKIRRVIEKETNATVLKVLNKEFNDTQASINAQQSYIRNAENRIKQLERMNY